MNTPTLAREELPRFVFESFFGLGTADPYEVLFSALEWSAGLSDLIASNAHSESPKGVDAAANIVWRLAKIGMVAMDAMHEEHRAKAAEVERLSAENRQLAAAWEAWKADLGPNATPPATPRKARTEGRASA